MHGHVISRFDCGRYGQVRFAQWRHPLEQPKVFDQAAIDAWATLIPRGSLCVDIGAHTGDTALPLGLCAGPEGLVLCFEPNGAVFPTLAANCELNRDRCNLQAFNVGIGGAEPQWRVFHYSDPEGCNGGDALRLEAGIGVTGHRFPRLCRVEPLEPYLPPDVRLAFLKIDTEGADDLILRANAARLLRDRTFIRFEVYPGLSRHERRWLLEAAEALNLDLYDWTTRRQPRLEHLLESQVAIDLLGCPKGDDPDA